jgi:anti-sigma regulatory factor (Ser/Thr protein kinase)
MQADSLFVITPLIAGTAILSAAVSSDHLIDKRVVTRNMSDESSSTLKSVVELEALAACWLAMEHAETLDEIEGAALSGLVGLTEANAPAVLGLQTAPARPSDRLNKEWRFHASDEQAAHVARREIATHLFETCGPAEEAAKSELIIGELLANTVAHAPGLVHLLLEWTGEHFVLIVRDSGPGLETAVSTLPTDLMAEGRRGLFLIHALSFDVELAKSPEGGAELRVILPLKPRDQSEFGDDVSA